VISRKPLFTLYRYAMDDKDLRYYLANIHCSVELPDLLIIDDLDLVVRYMNTSLNKLH
jgi:hypothetical protein